MACAAEQSDSPDSLWEQCLDFIADNLYCISDQEQCQPQQRKWALKPYVYLTQDIADALLAKFREKSLVLNDQLLNIFADPEKCRLQKINIQESGISDRTFASLMNHEPCEVNIKGCQNLTTTSLLSINQHGSNLTALSLGLYWNIFSDLDVQEKGERNSQVLKELMEAGLNLPHLRYLSIRNLTCLWQDNDALLTWILTPILSLTQLDLTDSEIVFEDSPNIGNLKALRHLCLHGVIIKNIDTAIDILIKLKELRALDLSCTVRDQLGPIPGLLHGRQDVASYLRLLVANLTRLEYLDLSGTALVGPDPNEVAKKNGEEEGEPMCSIPGLEGCQLQLLGLLDCKDACARKHIPAKQVTGTSNEEQVLRSLTVYMDCPRLLRLSIYSLLFLIRYIKVVDQKEALRLVLMALNSVKSDVDALADGFLVLIHLTKSSIKYKEMKPTIRKKVVLTIVNCLENHPSSESVLHRAWSCLTYFSLPDELLFVYGRVMRCGVYALQWPLSNNVQTVILYIMKHLSSQVDVKYKQIAGDIGIVSEMLSIIRNIASSESPISNILLRAWSVLWSLTDLAPTNCQNFIEEGGMEVFLQCLKIYHDEESLVQKMMGMLCNVAEVDHLRVHLMKAELITAFRKMFNMQLNISNSACGVTAYLLGDGPEMWTVEEDSPRDDVIKEMHDVISGWDLMAIRNVRYRSFVPMMKLLGCYKTSVVQYWAAWEVCNMTHKDPPRYCPMLESEGSLVVLQAFLNDERTGPHVRKLISKILEYYDAHCRGEPIDVEDPVMEEI